MMPNLTYMITDVQSSIMGAATSMVKGEPNPGVSGCGEQSWGTVPPPQLR